MNKQKFLATAIIVLYSSSVAMGHRALASPPPPVQYPQACTARFCVEVIPQDPFFPYMFRAVSKFEDGSTTLSVELKEGMTVAFHSKFVNKENSNRDLPIPEWRYDKNVAIASGCLVCNTSRHEIIEVIGVAVLPVPSEYGGKLSKAMDVCFWPLDMGSAGHGNGRNMSLGEKVCIGDVGEKKINLF